jgi:hypothetical protein
MRLFKLLRIYRAFSGLRLGAMAAAMNITPRELRLLEDGRVPSGAVMAKVITWALGTDEVTKKEEDDARNGSEAITPQDV